MKPHEKIEILASKRRTNLGFFSICIMAVFLLCQNKNISSIYTWSQQFLPLHSKLSWTYYKNFLTKLFSKTHFYHQSNCMLNNFLAFNIDVFIAFLQNKDELWIWVLEKARWDLRQRRIFGLDIGSKAANIQLIDYTCLPLQLLLIYIWNNWASDGIVKNKNTNIHWKWRTGENPI